MRLPPSSVSSRAHLPLSWTGLVVAEQLVDGRIQERRVASEPLHVVRVPEESQHAVADQVARRLEAGYEDEQHGRQQLLVRQPVTFLLRGQQGADQVLPRPAAPLVDDGLEVRVRFPGGVPDAIRLTAADERVDGESQHAGPLLEPVAVAGADAEHLGDDRDRQRISQRRHEIESVRAGDGVQQMGGRLLDLYTEHRHRLRRERLGDQGPQARVLGRIEVKQTQRDGRDQDAAGVAEALVIPKHRLHVPVAGQDPRVDQPQAVDGIDLPQRAIGRVRVFPDLRGGEIVGDARLPPLPRQQHAHCDRLDEPFDDAGDQPHRLNASGRGHPGERPPAAFVGGVVNATAKGTRRGPDRASIPCVGGRSPVRFPQGVSLWTRPPLVCTGRTGLHESRTFTVPRSGPDIHHDNVHFAFF